MTKIKTLIRITYWKLLKLIPSPVKDQVKEFLISTPWLVNPILYAKVRRVVKNRQDVKGIVIYPPTVDWSWMKQRPHQLIEGLSKKGYLCFYVNINHKQRSGRSYFNKINENLYVIGDVYVLQFIKKPIILVGWTDHYRLVQRFEKPVIIYDYLDDLSVSAEEVDAQKLEHHQYFLKESQIVAVTASKLEEDALRYRKGIISVPNAGNYKDFHLEKKPSLPKDMKRILESGKKVIGYYGALAKWFDYDLIKEVAKLRPDYEFVLIGPDYDNSIHSEHLDEIENIHWLGIKKYEELPAYLYYFDLAMIPFKVNEITRATSPVKIFEYMAGGKLTVSTALDECKKYKSVLVAKDSNDFAKKIDEAVKITTEKKLVKIIDTEARKNTWEARISVIEGALKGLNEK